MARIPDTVYKMLGQYPVQRSNKDTQQQQQQHRGMHNNNNNNNNNTCRLCGVEDETQEQILQACPSSARTIPA